MSRGNYAYRILRDTVVRWIHDEGFMMGAALAYYSLFSIAPLLVIALAIAGVFFGAEAARGELEHQLTGYFGPSVAKSVQTLLTAAQSGETGGALSISIWIGALLFGATSVFAQLKLALNRIWKVETPRHSGLKALLFNRLLALCMVAVVALLLLTSVLVSAAISWISSYATHLTYLSATALQTVDVAMTFLLLSILFAIIFRFLPDVRLGWDHVILGAVVTAGLFAIGKIGISTYIAHASVASGYGAASSILILILWIYYSAIIFLFGAEFTHVYSRAHHLPVEPIAADDEAEKETSKS